MRRGVWLAFVLLVAFGAESRAHPAAFTAAVARITREGDIHLTLRFDVVAYLLNDNSARIGDEARREFLRQPRPALERKVNEAADRLLHGVTAQTDAGVVVFQAIQFPTAKEVLDAVGNGPMLILDLEAELSGRLPVGCHTIRVRFPEVLENVLLSVECPGEEICFEPLEPAAISGSIPIRVRTSGVSDSAGFPATTPVAPVADGTPGSVVPESGSTSRSGTGMQAVVAPLALLWHYVAMGFRHILPLGLDHVLFILGLVLLNPKVRPLLFQVSAFTLAHSITLGLSVYGVLRLPSSVIEPLIALSIAFVAIENLLTSELKPWRTAVIFGFGLVHGLGFAGALNDLNLARQHFLTALLGFNAGVELGQLTVVVLGLLGLGAVFHWRNYRAFVAIPASGAIALVAIVWTIQRLPAW